MKGLQVLLGCYFFSQIAWSNHEGTGPWTEYHYTLEVSGYVVSSSGKPIALAWVDVGEDERDYTNRNGFYSDTIQDIVRVYDPYHNGFPGWTPEFRVCAQSQNHYRKCEIVDSIVLYWEHSYLERHVDFRLSRIIEGGCLVSDFNFRTVPTGCRDTRTGKIWSGSSGDLLRWNEAQDYCRTLQESGARDWALPDEQELRQIAGVTRAKTHLDFTTNRYFWSNTSIRSDDNLAYTVHLESGERERLLKNRSRSVVCVRRP